MKSLIFSKKISQLPRHLPRKPGKIFPHGLFFCQPDTILLLFLEFQRNISRGCETTAFSNLLIPVQKWMICDKLVPTHLGLII